MTADFEELQKQLPYYLTQEQKEGLVKALKDFPQKANYFTALHGDQMLQGDGWAGLHVMRFPDGAGKKIKGILLSNSCDIDPNNERVTPARVTFAPLIPVSGYVARLQASGLSQARIQARMESIRAQRTTSIFYISKGGALEEEHIALLDDLHTIPLDAFTKEESREKLFTLSLMGFYMFLMKLSIHFCRFHENVDRPATEVTG